MEGTFKSSRYRAVPPLTKSLTRIGWTIEVIRVMETLALRARRWSRLRQQMNSSNRCRGLEINKLSSKPLSRQRLRLLLLIIKQRQGNSQRASKLEWRIKYPRRRNWKRGSRVSKPFWWFTATSRSTSSKSSCSSLSSSRSPRMRRRSKSSSKSWRRLISPCLTQWLRSWKCSRWWTLRTANPSWAWSRILKLRSIRSLGEIRLNRTQGHRLYKRSIGENILMRPCHELRSNWLL